MPLLDQPRADANVCRVSVRGGGDVRGGGVFPDQRAWRLEPCGSAVCRWQPNRASTICTTSSRDMRWCWILFALGNFRSLTARLIALSFLYCCTFTWNQDGLVSVLGNI